MHKDDQPEIVLSNEEFYEHINKVSNTIWDCNRRTLGKTLQEKKDLGYIEQLIIDEDGFTLITNKQIITVDNVEQKIKKVILRD
tara:strand:- start:1781 stop:2032 length:252 start_codon:yes stop_codon:yes gene_type:complete